MLVNKEILSFADLETRSSKSTIVIDLLKARIRICNKELTLDVLRNAASFAELSGVLVARRSFEALSLSDLAP